MIWLSSKELYALFLDSDWWINLSRTKRRMVGHCERCQAKFYLQSHHVRYSENWFDTRLEDLQVLCRPCHEKEHHLTPPVLVDLPPVRSLEEWNRIRRNRRHKRHAQKAKKKSAAIEMVRKRNKARKLFVKNWRRNIYSGNWSH